MNRGELGLAEVEVGMVVEVVEVEVEIEVEVVEVGVEVGVGVDEMYYQLKRAAHSVYPQL